MAEDVAPKQNETAKNSKRLPIGAPMGVALPMGVGVAAAMGAATDDMGVWVAIGVAAGAVAGGIGTAVQNKNRKSG